MRVLQVHNRHATRGGADIVLDQEAQLLSQAGHDVEQIVAAGADESGRSRLALAVNAVWSQDAAATLAATIRSFRPDVVHVHTPFPVLSPVVFRSAYDAGCATVTTVHGYRYSCIKGTCLRDGEICEDCVGTRWKTAGVRHRCYHGSLAGSVALTVSLTLHRRIGTFTRDVGRFLTLTPFARDLLVRDGIPAHRVTVKPNFVPDPGPPLAMAHRGSPYALFVGRLVEEKGVRTLLEAWRKVDRRLPLWVAGDGPLRPLVRAAADSGWAVRDLGWLPQGDLEALQREATMTVVPSEWYEAGQPLVLLQALAAGTPVVCSDLDNICQDVVATGAGRAFRTGDAESLAANVLAMLDDRAALDRAAAAARELYQSAHTPTHSLGALEQVYDEVVAERRHHAHQH